MFRAVAECKMFHTQMRLDVSHLELLVQIVYF